MASEDRGKAIDLAFTQIEKQFGKGSIMKLGQSDALKGISVISTGSIIILLSGWISNKTLQVCYNNYKM